MSIELIIVALLLFATIILLASNRYPADFVLLGTASLLLISGILTPAEALAGFATPVLATIAVLYVVVAGLQESGAVAWLAPYLLGKSRQYNICTTQADLTCCCN